MATGSRARGRSRASPAGAPESASASVCAICSTLAPRLGGAHAVHPNRSVGLRRLDASSRRPPRPACVSKTCFTRSRRVQPRRCRRPRTPRPRASRAPAAPAGSRRSWRWRRSAAAIESTAGRTATRDGVALPAALPLGEEVHLHVGDVRAAAQEVVPHQAVEVERRRRCRRRSRCSRTSGTVRRHAATSCARGVRRLERRRPRAGRASPGTRSCCRTAASSPAPARTAEQRHRRRAGARPIAAVERRRRRGRVHQRRHEPR